MLYGLALAYVLDLPVVWAMIGAVAPDGDILFAALTHRGVVHTPVAGAALTAALFLGSGKRAPAAAFGTGYLTHLFLDTFTYTGIMWLFPVATHYSLELARYDSLPVNGGIILLAALVPLADRYGAEVRRWLK